MNAKSCFFIGNRNTPNSIKELLADAIEKHIVEYAGKREKKGLIKITLL